MGLVLPGNSFASTVAQANFIASLIHCSAWGTISKGHGESSNQVQKLDGTQVTVPKGAKRSMDEAHLKSDQRETKIAKTLETGGKKGTKRSSDNHSENTGNVLKRCRFKQPDPFKGVSSVRDQIEQLVAVASEIRLAKAPGRPKGSKSEDKTKISRDGKAGCLSVWEKMQLILEYERLKELGTIKYVEKWMLANGKLRGGYQGCMSKSKWLGSRQQYKWDLFIKNCPQLSKKVKEVPNALLDVMGVAVLGICLRQHVISFFYNI